MSDSTENQEENLSLPILAHKQRILDAMRFNRVIVISGETGSGKTTQLPKFCMELEKKRLICCTQPRRVATISVAERVEEELGNQRLVGWQHRFQRQTDKNNRIKFVTDGILLAEIKNDPMLRQYGIIMIDEAHERTLNIDFLLGYLKQLLIKRNDLRVIISSATIETQRFSEFFNNAPVLHISGRTYPITYKYLPPDEDDDDETDLPRIVSNAVVNAIQSSASGDILVFLPGERDIKEACEILRGRFLPDCEIIPLMASLPPHEQRRAFTLVPGKRRVILATNVAETSVTIPNIKIVIDSGVARISRFSYRSHIKKLHIEPISQASANQRAGRCGRVAPGLCIRLYSEDDYKKRPQFTDPEIRRTSLAGTILTMLSRRLGDISTFPFIEPPANVAVREGYKELLWLKAIVPAENSLASANAPTSYQLTPLGRAIAQLTIEPRLARILFESKHFGVYSEVLTIVAYLSGETVYVRPTEELDKANQAHAQFKSPHSDFDSILRLWEFFHPATGDISGTQKRKLCQKNYISFKRILEWEEIRLQLHKSFVEHEKHGEKRGEGQKAQQQSHPATIPPIEPPEVRSISHIHQAMLCGFLPNIGKYDEEKREYTGIDGKSFVIFPASSLAKRTPKWLLAAELVDTSRTFARNVSPVLIEWIEKAAEHVSKVHYTGQFWDGSTGTARATKTTTLGALTIATNPHADISKLYPIVSRDLFISEGIAQCQLPENIPPCLRQSFSNMRRALEQAAKLRKVDAADIATDCVAFYESRLPEECVNLAAFKRWLNTLPHKEKASLIFNPTLSAEAGLVDKQQFPSELRFAGQCMRLSYKNAPGEEEDGITCTLLPEQIPFVRYLRSDWLVPGYLNDLVYFYITSIPQQVLHPALQLVEGSNFRNRVDSLVRECYERLSSNKYNVPITAAISHAIYAATDCHIPEAIIAKAIPTEHLQLRWRVISANKKVLYETRKLSDLYEFYDELSKLVKLPKLTFNFKPEQYPNSVAPREVVLGNCGARELAIFVAGGEECHVIGSSAHEAQQLLLNQIIEGILKQNSGLVKAIAGGGGAPPSHGGKKSSQSVNSLQSLSALTQASSLAPDELSSAAAALMPSAEDLARGVLRNFILAHGLVKAKGLSASEQQHLVLLASKLKELAHGIALLWDACMDMLDNVDEDTAFDVTEQLNWLVFPGYMRSTPMSNIAQLMRYLEGIETRLANAQLKPDVEERKLRDFGQAWQRYIELYANGARPSYNDAALQAYRWGVEEARLALWVPRLAQAGYSLKRLNELWHNVLSLHT